MTENVAKSEDRIKRISNFHNLTVEILAELEDRTKRICNLTGRRYDSTSVSTDVLEQLIAAARERNALRAHTEVCCIGD